MAGIQFRRLLASLAIGLSDLRRRGPSNVLNSAEGATVALLDNGKVAAYLVPRERFVELWDAWRQSRPAD